MVGSSLSDHVVVGNNFSQLDSLTDPFSKRKFLPAYCNSEKKLSKVSLVRESHSSWSVFIFGFARILTHWNSSQFETKFPVFLQQCSFFTALKINTNCRVGGKSQFRIFCFNQTLFSIYFKFRLFWYFLLIKSNFLKLLPREKASCRPNSGISAYLNTVWRALPYFFSSCLQPRVMKLSRMLVLFLYYYF